jgi:undecaprenyl-diphosphatase
MAAGGRVSRLETDLFRLVNDLPPALSPPLQVVMQAGSLGAVVAAGAVTFVARRRRLARDLAVAGTAAWLAAKVAKTIVARGRPALVLGHVTLRGVPATGLGFPSGHAAVVAALATAAGPHLSRRGRHLTWVVVALVSIARVNVGAHLPLDTVGGVGLGWAIGAAVHLLWGAPGGRPTLAAVQHALVAIGFAPAELAVAPVDARGSAPFYAVGPDGSQQFVKVVGREQRDADWLFKAWRWLAFREVEDEAPFASGKQLVEHEAYLSMLAARAGVRTPALLTTGSTADGSAVLVAERVNGHRLDGPGATPPSGELLRAVWGEVAKLHAARIAHRDLRLANLVIDDSDRPWVVDFGFAEAAASDRRLAQDRAELLASLTTVTGVERAVASAAEVLGTATLAPVVPLLQPLALTAATRRGLRSRPGALRELQAAVARRAGVELDGTAPETLTRVRPRTVLGLVVGAVAVHVLLPQAAELRHTVDALRTARWAWLIPAAAASALTYVLAASGIAAASGQPLPTGRTTLVQLASSVANRLAPGGLGGAATNVRYLQRSGLDRSEAVAAVGVTSAVGFLVHGVGLLAVGLAVAFGHGGSARPHLPDGWTLLVVAAAALAVAGVLRTAFGREWILPSIRATSGDMRDVFDQPRRAARIVVAAIGVTGGYILALAASLHAFGAHGSLLTVAAAYLAGAAIGSASPTPGGLGAVEAALVAGLTRLGVAAGPAIAGVLAFRLITYWLPILPGALAVRALRRRQVL